MVVPSDELIPWPRSPHRSKVQSDGHWSWPVCRRGTKSSPGSFLARANGDSKWIWRATSCHDFFWGSRCFDFLFQVVSRHARVARSKVWTQKHKIMSWLLDDFRIDIGVCSLGPHIKHTRFGNQTLAKANLTCYNGHPIILPGFGSNTTGWRIRYVFQTAAS